jgi:N-acetylglucosaminyldiphosphoundecaprenol N-acetyl-beta-D-mannosaminyltransferase
MENNIAQAASFRSCHILGMRVDNLTYSGITDSVLELIHKGQRATICVANVHMVMEAFDDSRFREMINRSTFITSDGMPLVWGLRLLGQKGATRVYGPQLMTHLLEMAETRQIPVGLYGGTPKVRELLEKRLSQKYPRLRLVYSHSPPFRSLSLEEEMADVGQINKSKAKLLFVGLGCPKQEKWMTRYEERVNAVMVGVGAAFDFQAGTKPQAPRWMQCAGLEWLFRLVCEPRRLAGRYLRHNPRFLWLFYQQLRRERKTRGDGKRP